MSAILLRKKKFFRPPTKFEKMCIKVFVTGFVLSTVMSIVLSFISSNSSIAPQEVQIKPFRIDKYNHLLIVTNPNYETLSPAPKPNSTPYSQTNI